MARRIRALVVDDSSLMRTGIGGMLESTGTIEVIGRARDGAESVTMTRKLQPDVLTMDVLMPGMDGIAAVREIMSSAPTPVVMVSSITADGAAATIEALAAGAVDFVDKSRTSANRELPSLRDELVEKVTRAAKANRRALRHVATTSGGAPALTVEALSPRIVARHVICIGISTGGPATLRSLLAELPRDLSAAVLIAQHMPAAYTARFATNLDQRCRLSVREAAPGDRAVRGHVLVAPGNGHLVVNVNGVVAVEPASGKREPTPSADALMRSAAESFGPRCVGVVMTGMGNDGSRGAQAIKEFGGHVIAQDEATSVVHGMPSSAVATGCVDQVLALDGISAALVDLVS